MSELTVHLGELLTITIMAVALGMDAFSLGIGIGMKGIRLLDVMKISLVVGFFHILMPLFGMFTGHYLGSILGDIAILTGGGLLILLGSHMVYSSLKGDDVKSINHSTFWGVLLFALTVSIDSFSVGISLGLFASDLILSVMMFGLLGCLMSTTGLMLGRRVAPWFGDYGEALGGVILFVFGLKFIL